MNASSQPQNTVAILDAGAQYGKLIDRMVRGLGVRSEVLPLNTPRETLQHYDAIIITGGPESVYGEGAPRYDAAIFETGKATLGICYGMQLMNYVHGGEVKKLALRQDGQLSLQITADSLLFTGLDSNQDVLMTHGDSIAKVAEDFHSIATSEDIIAAIHNPEKHLYGVQFHPEVSLTPGGRDMMHNFLFSIAGLRADFTMDDREQAAIDYIREAVGDNELLVLASGGVDSTVTAALAAKALKPEKIHAIHIDSGFMRLNESHLVAKELGAQGIDVHVVRAADDFFDGSTTINGETIGPLHETTDPEHKRAIIGDTFISVSEKAIKELGLDSKKTYLAQGTLRPDLIESASHLASGNAQTIKTHHNDTQAVRELREAGRVVEPLKELHKDEVREMAMRLGLSEKLAWRQPFPGPGLAIRLLAAREPAIDGHYDKTNAQLADQHSDENILATLLPVRTVGVQGDGRSYGYLVALSGEEDWATLIERAKKIPQTIHNVNRVVYVFGEKVSGPIKEITPTLPEPIAVEQLRKADAKISEILSKYNLHRTISQVPVVSFPVGFGQPEARSIGIRTILTPDFMTGAIAVPGKEMPLDALHEMVDAALSVEGIARVAYDLTAKPPATTEWE